MNLAEKLKEELKAVFLVALYFGCWLAAMVLIKQLILEEYHIQFSGLSKAVIGALVLSKVVIVLEHVPLGSWVRRQAVWVDIVLRSALYMVGVFAVLLLEKAFEGRHEYGGFGASLNMVFQHEDIYHVWVNLIILSGSILVYNVFAAINTLVGNGGLIKVLRTPLPRDGEGGKQTQHGND